MPCGPHRGWCCVPNLNQDPQPWQASCFEEAGRCSMAIVETLDGPIDERVHMGPYNGAGHASLWSFARILGPGGAWSASRPVIMGCSSSTSYRRGQACQRRHLAGEEPCPCFALPCPALPCECAPPAAPARQLSNSIWSFDACDAI
jgi:hypothetical protein